MSVHPDFTELKSKLTYETTGEFKNIELTDEQYSRLMTLIKIGLRVAGCEKDNPNVPLIDIDQYLSSYNKQFNAQHLITEYKELGGIYMSSDILSKQAELNIKIYGDHFLKRELSHSLATRDFVDTLDVKPRKPMKEFFEETKAKYLEEFEKNEFKNLVLVDQ